MASGHLVHGLDTISVLLASGTHIVVIFIVFFYIILYTLYYMLLICISVKFMLRIGLSSPWSGGGLCTVVAPGVAL